MKTNKAIKLSSNAHPVLEREHSMAMFVGSDDTYVNTIEANELTEIKLAITTLRKSYPLSDIDKINNQAAAKTGVSASVEVDASNPENRLRLAENGLKSVRKVIDILIDYESLLIAEIRKLNEEVNPGWFNKRIYTP